MASLTVVATQGVGGLLAETHSLLHQRFGGRLNVS